MSRIPFLRSVLVAGGAVAVDAEAVEQATPELGELGRPAVAGPMAGHDDGLADDGAGLVAVLPEQDDAVGELERLVDVVRHEQHRGGLCGVLLLDGLGIDRHGAARGVETTTGIPHYPY